MILQTQISATILGIYSGSHTSKLLLLTMKVTLTVHMTRLIVDGLSAMNIKMTPLLSMIMVDAGVHILTDQCELRTTYQQTIATRGFDPLPLLIFVHH